MSNSPDLYFPESAAAFLDAHPDMKAVEFWISDLNGVPRGKWVPRDHVVALLETGMRMPHSIFSLDIWGDEVSMRGVGLAVGDPDGVCLATPTPITVAPWLGRGAGQVMTTMFKSDGSPYPGDPRQVLASVVRAFDAAGLTPVVATELEFYLLKPGSTPEAMAYPMSGREQTTCQVYGLDTLQEFEAVLHDIAEACAAHGVPGDTVTAELGAGQFEINLVHIADVLKAADNTILFKRIVRGVARKHGMNATFMAKPFADRPGNGFHVHVSVVDRDGRNIFANGTEQGSEALGHAIGGLLRTIPDVTALLAPHYNSYRRFRPNSYAPIMPNWGVDNRATAVRVPAGRGESKRLEHRVAGADANPYLVIAAILAGMHHGIIAERRAVPENSHDGDEPAVLGWAAALDALESSDFAGRYFDDTFRHMFVNCKRHELGIFADQIGPFEYESYLNTL